MTEIDPVFRLPTYDYELDRDLIAQFPAEKRDASRLEVVFRDSPANRSRIEHRSFADIVQYFRPGDLLVMNDSRVMPARLTAAKASTGGRTEVLLIRAVSPGSVQWEALIRGSVSPGQILRVDKDLEVLVRDRFSDGRWGVEVRCNGSLPEVLDRIGRVPLPPYIRRDSTENDRERYQTVYARRPEGDGISGSVAAPTAGLHFTQDLMDKIRIQGARIGFVTLHIGPGTFQPVRSEDIRRHRMEPEYFEISEETVRLLEETAAVGGRVVAVGTSAARTLESSVSDDGGIRRSGATDLFIYPGYGFKRVRGLLTNFHMPKSTLFMLVCGLAGIRTMKSAYREAVRLRYRFLSYGDAMLIL